MSPTPFLTHFDDDGYWWSIDTETGEYLTHSYAFGPYHESTDCTGPGYVWFVPLPMVPFTIAELPGDLYVRPRGLSAYEVCHESVQQGAFCVVTSDCLEMLSIAEVTPSTPITVPSSPWIGPLHAEP